MSIPTRLTASELTQEDRLKQEQLQKQYEEEQQRQELIDDLFAKATAKRGTRQGQCVIAVRSFLQIGRDQIQGYARNTKINSKEPEIGSIIKLNMSKAGHVGVVLNFDDEVITYYDSNGDWRQRGEIRKMKRKDKRILGYRIIE